MTTEAPTAGQCPMHGASRHQATNEPGKMDGPAVLF